MEDITQQIPPAFGPEAEHGQFEHCEHCSAPVDHDQRYCVNCGTHRRHVPDPAAKYMSRVSAHTGVRAGGVTGAIAGGAVVKGASMSGLGGLYRGGGDGISLLGGIALALIPVAAVVGVAIGRSSNNHDKALISALEKQRSEVQTQTVASANTPAASASTANSTKSSKTKTSTKAGKKSSTKKSVAKGSGNSTTSNGSVKKISGSKVTAAEQASGSKAAQKIQNSTGKSYVQGANNLPGTVVVGP